MTTTTPETAIVPAAEAEAITRWEALAHQIAQASQDAEGRTFLYREPGDNKAARSYIAGLRRLRGSIERARKDAKAVHLERGRAVDSTAKALAEAVDGLIEPHQRELDAIAAEEQFRIAQHRATLDRIAAMSEGVATSAEADARLQQLAAIDTSGLEEFRTAGEARHAEATERLLELLDTLRQQEAERAELEALRAEKAARDEAYRIERIRRDAIDAERRQAAEAAQRAEAERQARERAEIERQAREQAEAERRERDAIAAAEAARQAQAAAEERERQARAAAEAAQRAEADRQEEEARRQQQAAEAERLRRDAFTQHLADLIEEARDAGSLELAELIIAGQLHPAITIDWTKA